MNNRSRPGGSLWRLVAAVLLLLLSSASTAGPFHVLPMTPDHHHADPPGHVRQEDHAMSLHHQRQWIVQNYPALFDSMLDRIHNSPNEDERKWLFYGFADATWIPVFASRDDLLKHGHFLGDPGSGKTARGLGPLTSQLIAAGDVSVVIFDLKGDLHLYANARAEAERAGLPFKWFTNRIGWSSHVWNPFAEPFITEMSHAQRAQSILASLGIPYTENYGSGFFSSQQRTVLKKIVQRFAGSIHSLADLLRYLNDPNAYKGLGPRSDWDNARHAPSVLEMLVELLPLQATQADVGARVLSNAIKVHDLVTQPTVAYWWLQSPIDANQPTVITRLALYSQMAAMSLYQHQRPTVPVFNIIDESQYVATQGLPQILDTARSLGLGILLAHQSLDQLKVGAELDLTNRVKSSTAVTQVFRASDLVIRDYLTKTGGESLYHLLQWEQLLSRHEAGFSPWASTKVGAFSGVPQVGVQQVIRPTLEPNRIMEVSAHPFLSLVNFTEDKGPVQYQGAWTPVLSGFHIDLQTYQDRLKYARWPAASESEGAIVVPRDWEPGKPPAVPSANRVGDLESRVREAQQRLQRKQDDRS